MTSSANHAVLFTKEHCLPCTLTKDYLREIYEEDTDLANYISVMKKENHSALIAAYGLTVYPTLLIVSPSGLQLDQVVGGEAIRKNLKGILIALRANTLT